MRYFLSLLLIVLGLTAYRAWVVFNNGLPLYVDEAQYWFWAQNLAWGYYSKPPMIAAVIAATTAICGESEACVRVASLIFYPLSTIVLFFLTSRLFDEKIAGSFHFTPGQAYEEADNGNRSAVHWDLVQIQRKEYGGGEIYFDGKLIRKDGLFTLESLKHLNPQEFLKRMGKRNHDL